MSPASKCIPKNRCYRSVAWHVDVTYGEYPSTIEQHAPCDLVDDVVANRVVVRERDGATLLIELS